MSHIQRKRCAPLQNGHFFEFPQPTVACEMPTRGGRATPRPVTDATTPAGPSAYQRRVDANKEQNKRVIDSLGAPQLELERAPKRCGPKHFDPAAGPLYIYCRRMPLQAEGTEGLWAATTDEGEQQADARPGAGRFGSDDRCLPRRWRKPCIHASPLYWCKR